MVKVTPRDVDAALEKLPRASLAFRALTLLRVGGLGDLLDPELRRRGNHVEVASLPLLRLLPPELADVVREGALVFPKPDGTAYAPSSFKQALNKALKDALGATLRDVVQAFRPLEISKPLETILNARLEDYKLDPDLSRALVDLDVFKTSVKTFVLVEIPSVSSVITIQYELSRIAAGLPFYDWIADGYRLPSVDHVNRDASDLRRDQLRYCTLLQACRNRCSGARVNKTLRSSSLYHNVSANGQINVPTDDDRVAIWFSMYAHVYKELKQAEVEALEPQWLTGNCRPREELDGFLVHRLDGFVGELLTALSRRQVSQRLGLELFKFALDPADFAGLPLLEEVYTLAPDVFRVRKTFPPALAAVAADVIKLSLYGEFAHLNFLRSPSPSKTVADVAKTCDKTPWTPCDILNRFEALLDDAALRKWNSKHGIDIHKKRRYTIVDRRISATFVDDIVKIDDGEIVKVDETDLNLNGPFVAYRYASGLEVREVTEVHEVTDVVREDLDVDEDNEDIHEVDDDGLEELSSSVDSSSRVDGPMDGPPMELKVIAVLERMLEAMKEAVDALKALAF
jgi:hypothetical protein